MQHTIEALATALQQPLPGVEAQYKMAHAIRTNYDLERPDNVRVACVLALLYPKADDWHIVFIRRTSTDERDRHAGQIGLPGGKREETDRTLEMVALREAQEEIGVAPDDVRVLGRLTELYIPVSNFVVYPFVGHLNYRPQFIPQELEVDEVIEVPFQHFGKSDIVQKTDIELIDRVRLRNVPYFDLEGQVLWGATAMMMSELIEVCKRDGIF